MSNLSGTEKSKPCLLERQSRESLFEEFLFYCDSDSNVENYATRNVFEEGLDIRPPFIPEKHLLYAVLGRAYHDLAPNASKEDRRAAIKWFERKKADYQNLSYKYIVQALDLTDNYQDMIKLAVKKAREIQCI